MMSESIHLFLCPTCYHMRVCVSDLIMNKFIEISIIKDDSTSSD